MFELLADALKSLAAYPPFAALGGFIIIIVYGVWLLLRGERDRKNSPNGNGMPAWLLYGPVKDVLSDLRDMAEQSRASNKLLDQMIQNGNRLVESNTQREREQREQTQVLEDIRNNLVMRMDTTTAHPQQPKPRRGPPGR